MESIARRRVDDVSERGVPEGAGMGLPCPSGTAVQHGLGTGRSKYYPSGSARTLLKECLAFNPPVQLHPHQRLTGMSSDQVIQFARAVGIGVSLVTFGMLEDVLLKIGGKTERIVGDKGSGQSRSFSRSGSTVMESIDSRSFFPLPAITESSGSGPSAGDLAQQLCSTRQANAALDFSGTEVIDINDTYSMKTLGQMRSDARKKGNLYKWSRVEERSP